MADQTAAVDAAAKALYESFTPAAGRKQWPDVPHWTLYVFKEAALAALQAAEPHLGPEMKPGRWWRALSADGQVWSESSNEDEVRASMTQRVKSQGPYQLQRLFFAPQIEEWRDVAPEKED